jgi:DNA-binding GntR family transcriptional regulator
VTLVDSFRGPILMSLEEARDVAPEMGGLGTKEHERFVEAVSRRDADDAARIMREHLARTADRVRHDH